MNEATTPTTATVSPIPVLLIERIRKPSLIEQLTNTHWKITHTPTGWCAGTFRLKRTASRAVRWLTDAIPTEVLNGSDPTAIIDAGNSANVKALYRELYRND